MRKKAKPEINLSEEINDIVKKNEMLEASNKRLAADFDNYRKRIETEKTKTSQAANSDVILKLFPILDNFRRSSEHAPSIELTSGNIPPLSEVEFTRIHAYFEGVRQIERQLEGTLQEYGLKRIETTNQLFDHNKMEAIAYESHPEIPDNTVIDEIEGGYELNGKVIRPAKVRVSKGSS